MTVTAADPTLGVAAYLSIELEAVTGTLSEGLKVWRPQVPKSEESRMPAEAVIVTPAGGGALFGNVRYGIMDDIVNLTCYGKTRMEAENLARRAMVAMRNLRQSEWEGVVLRWARISAGPVSEVYEETNWPFALVVCQVAHNI